MKKILLLVMIPFFSFAQNLYDINDSKTENHIPMIGCVDLDETLIDLVAIFGDTSLLDGLLGCSELIPTLESGILSAFLPFDIPLDCNTDLTPFGYLDMNVSDVCECSCQKYLKIFDYDLSNRKLIQKFDILGRKNSKNSVKLHIYNDGSIEKKYLVK